MRHSCERKKCRSLESLLHEEDMARVVLQRRKDLAVQVGQEKEHQEVTPAGLLQRQIHTKVTYTSEVVHHVKKTLFSFLPVEQLELLSFSFESDSVCSSCGGTSVFSSFFSDDISSSAQLESTGRLQCQNLRAVLRS